MQYTDGLLLCFGFFLVAGCETTTDRIIPCPVIRMPNVGYGALVGTGSFAPGACIEVFDEGRRLAHTNVSQEGTFAIQFASGGFPDDAIQLRITGAGSRAVEYTVRVNDRLHAAVIYEPGSSPLVANESGQVRIQGTLVDPVEAAPFSLEPFSSEPITTAWVTNWRTGLVGRMTPQPQLGAPFEAYAPGAPHDPIGPITRHGDVANAIGGCYWPEGAGYAFGCTQESVNLGTCGVGEGSGCARRRGCEPLLVEEPERPAPFNQGPPIPEGPPDRVIPDAGPPDAPLPPPDAFGDAGGIQ
jgi:hypothetical protein